MVDQLISLNQDVVLDTGMWTRQERQVFIERCDDLGYDSDSYFIYVDTNVRRERMINRNKEKRDTCQFDICTVIFNTMEKFFRGTGE